MLTEVRDCDLLIVVTSSTFLKRKFMLKEKKKTVGREWKMSRLKMESLNAHCLDHQAANMTPPSTHCDLPDGMLQTVRAPESLRFQGSRQFGIDTCMVNGPNMRGNPTARRTQPSLPVSQALAPCETTRLQGQATSPSLRSKVCAARVKTCAGRNTARLHPSCARRTSLRVLDSPDKAQHQLSPPKLRTY